MLFIEDNCCKYNSKDRRYSFKEFKAIFINPSFILILMVGLRKFHGYRKPERPYMRHSKYKKKNYVRSKPPHKVARFEMGDKNKKYTHVVRLISRDPLQIRHNSLESARLAVNTKMERTLGNEYFLRLNVFPFQIMRENKMLGGAHADRLQTGMAHSFGKPTSVLARLQKGNTIFSAFVNKAGIEPAKMALQMANPRLPGRALIVIEENPTGKAL